VNLILVKKCIKVKTKGQVSRQIEGETRNDQAGRWSKKVQLEKLETGLYIQPTREGRTTMKESGLEGGERRGKRCKRVTGTHEFFINSGMGWKKG